MPLSPRPCKAPAPRKARPFASSTTTSDRENDGRCPRTRQVALTRGERGASARHRARPPSVLPLLHSTCALVSLRSRVLMHPKLGRFQHLTELGALPQHRNWERDQEQPLSRFALGRPLSRFAPGRRMQVISLHPGRKSSGTHDASIDRDLRAHHDRRCRSGTRWGTRWEARWWRRRRRQWDPRRRRTTVAMPRRDGRSWCFER